MLIHKIKSKIITRQVALKGKAYVNVGDVVTPPDILGIKKTSAGFHNVNVAVLLNVPPTKAINYIIKKEGDKVFKGELLAEKSQLFKKETQKVYVSIDGSIDSINTKTGQVLIKIVKKQENIPAGVWGKVVKVDIDQGVSLDTQVLEMQGKAGRGYNREGSLKVIASNHEAIKENMIKEEHQGKILLGGSIINKEAVNKAVQIGVSGIVCGSINFENFQSIGEDSDVGVTVVVLEGYGTIPIHEYGYTELIKYDGYYGMINGKDAQITIPLDPGNKYDESKSSNHTLEVDALVRIIFEDQIGIVGKIKEILPEYTFSSKISAPAVRITDKNKEYIIPQSNIEILS